MKLTNRSGVPVYTISGSSTARPLPEWLARKRKRSLKNDPEFANRIELLQDFEFEEASQCIRISDDGQWVMSTGTYKPQIHTHYLPHLSLSYARHTISLNTTFLLLSSDYSKSLHLQTDRSIEFHTPQGCHYTTRIPRYGRDMKYDKRSAEVLVPSVGVNEDGLGEVFRLNLEAGRFMRAYEVNVGDNDLASVGGGVLQSGIETGSVNTAAVAEESHNLLAFGTSRGTVEFWDSRSRNRVGILPRQSDTIDGIQGVTSLEFHRSGLTLATGSSAGLVHLYDLRSSLPLLKKDQGYGYPIQTLTFLTPSTISRSQDTEPKILSADKRIIKIWDSRDGSPWTSIEPAVDLNSVAWFRDSGMLLTANEGRAQHSFFIPQLGPAPKWCSFIDNLVEEMAEDPDDPNAFTSQSVGEVFDNYKFLTMPQLKALNLAHLVGTTNLLRPYMHGFFVASRLYEEAKLIADPRVWEEERAKRIKEKIDKERESRIRGKKKVTVTVNRKLAERLLEKEEKEQQRLARRALTKASDASAAISATAGKEGATASANQGFRDPRFEQRFQDPDFTIDERSHEFKSLNASTKPDADADVVERPAARLTAVEEELLEDRLASSDSLDTSEEEEVVKQTKHSEGSEKISSVSYKRSGHRAQKPPQMQVTSSKRPQQLRDRSFGSRVAKNGSAKSRITDGGRVGEREITFAPERKRKPDKIDVKDKRNEKGRRSASGNVLRTL